MKNKKFNTWLDTFNSEKGIDTDFVFEIDTNSDWGKNFIPVGAVVEYIKACPDDVQNVFKNQMVKIDFANGNVYDFYKYCAKGMAK